MRTLFTLPIPVPIRVVVVVALAASCGSRTVAAQRILQVPAQFATVQKAIDAAAGGDTVLVSAGTYRETIDFLGKTIKVRSVSGPERTTLDAQGKGSVVVFQNWENRGALLEGFTVTGGTGTYDSGYVCGGGIFCKGAAPTIRGNIITANNTTGSGGGIYVVGSGGVPLIKRNTISHNRASWGGGFYQWFSPPGQIMTAIEENTFRKNSASNGGGAIAVQYSAAEIRGNLIVDNTAGRSGGVDYYNTTPVPNLIEGNRILDNRAGQVGGITMAGTLLPVFANNVVAGNVSSLYHAGGVDWAGTTGLILNNTITANSAAADAGGIRINLSTPGQLTVANTIVWGNQAGRNGNEIFVRAGRTPTVTHCNIRQGWPGVRNLDADPHFIDPGRRDFHLRGDSMCINQGAPWTGIATDFEGDPRQFGSSMDIGADEVHYRLYRVGAVKAGSTFYLRMIGIPGHPATLGLAVGKLARAPALPGLGGHLHLDPAAGLVVLPLGVVTTQGYVEVPAKLPRGFPPITFYAQGLNNRTLTNLETLRVE